MKDDNLLFEKIALCGFMGAGKSSIGMKLGHISKKSLLDLDRELQKMENQVPSYFIEKYGVSYFRVLERSTLLMGLQSEPDILVLGGGTLHFRDNKALVAEQYNIIWVDTSFEEICRRLAKSPGEIRPLWNDHDLYKTKRLYESRLELYRRNTFQIDGDKPLDQIVDEIISNFLV